MEKTLLNNPNLTLDKMLEVMEFGTSIVGIALLVAIVILIYIYRYEIGIFLKYGFSKNKKDRDIVGLSKVLKNGIGETTTELKEKQFHDKVDDLLGKFNKLPLDIADDEESEIQTTELKFKEKSK